MAGYVVCIGKNCIDEYYQMESYPALGDKVLLEYTGAIRRLYGQCGNRGRSAGCRLLYDDALGDDAYTEVLMNTMKSHNVKTDFIEFEEGVPISRR